MGPLAPQVTASPSKSDMFAVMAVGEDFTKTGLEGDLHPGRLKHLRRGG